MDRRNVDILCVRMDKIGDLVLTLPVDEHPVFAGQRVHWFVTKGLGFIPEQAAPKRQFTEFKRGFSPLEFFRMYQWLKRHQPQTAVLMHVPWWVSLAAYLAGVPERIGRKSQWHSFLFLNVAIRQKRSQADRHESDYNFDLVEWGFNRLGLRRTFHLNALKARFLRLVPPNPFGTIEARGLKPQAYRVVHAGMGGSALNWPADNYAALIRRLSQQGPVVLTGTKADQKHLDALKGVRELENVRWLVDELRPLELLDVLSQARSVIAPSTGVLHLAAALGTPVVGIYSPRRVEHPLRWGPKGLHTRVCVPPVQQAENFAPDIMTQITPDEVEQAVHDVERPHGANAQLSL